MALPTLARSAVAPANVAPSTVAPANVAPLTVAPLTVAPSTVAGPAVTPTVAAATERLASAVREMQAVLGATSPGALSGDEALVLVDLFARAERTAASGIALLSPRVVQTGAHAKVGHYCAADWLGAVSGSSAAVAKDRLAAATTASADAALTEALQGGTLSCAQLSVLGRAEAAAPGSAQTLLELTGAGASHQELCQSASVLAGAARRKEDEAARRARVHERRHVRWRQCPEGGIKGAFFCDEVQWAKVAPRLEAEAKARWKLGGSNEGAALEAYRLDAFIDLLAGTSPGPGPGRASGARVETVVVVDAAALRRGTTKGDETCQIEGIGPVSVGAATELLGQAALRYVIKEGFDIKTVTRSSRTIANALAAALRVRDRTCCVPGCGKVLGLENDHVVVDYHHGGPTELDNLVRLCPGCHALKTFGGWRLNGEPGHFTWVPPEHPKSAGAISRARKVAAAKGQAKAQAKGQAKAQTPSGVTGERNRLRRT